MKEINEDRIKHSKKKIVSLTKKEVMFDEAIGELIENKDTKHIKESITDPESGCFHKGEKEKCFAYTHQVFCDKNGYKQYKSNPDKFANCPLKDRCTKSKNHQKIILRHIWEEYKEQANENRYTQNWKDNYPKRKETIERVFGDCKEQHNLRFTRVRGLRKNGQNTTLIFACHNLKKWLIGDGKKSLNQPLIMSTFIKISKLFKKEAYSFLNMPLCQQPETNYF